MKILLIQLFAIVSILGTQVSGYPQERLISGESRFSCAFNFTEFIIDFFAYWDTI